MSFFYSKELLKNLHYFEERVEELKKERDDWKKQYNELNARFDKKVNAEVYKKETALYVHFLEREFQHLQQLGLMKAGAK